jgi:DUF1680 family protein
LHDDKYKQAMEHAFTLLTTEQQFASGGWGPNETFITPHRGELHASLSSTVDHFETPCGSYAATKLARYLTRFTAQPSDTNYADNLERVLYNSILAVKLPDSAGDYPYYSTYSPAAEKVYYPKKWPCCSGTLVQTVADYPLNLYFQSADGLYVSQYIPSKLSFRHAGTFVRLTQSTHFPAEDSSVITIEASSPVALTLYLRMPAWLAAPATVKVNGKPVKGLLRSGTYAAISRMWRTGDRVDVELPQSFHTEPIDDRNQDVVALMHGPVQYVALNPANDLSKDRLTLPAGLKQVAPEAFVEMYGGAQVVFVPLYQVRNETYTSYFSKA